MIVMTNLIITTQAFSKLRPVLETEQENKKLNKKLSYQIKKKIKGDSDS